MLFRKSQLSALFFLLGLGLTLVFPPLGPDQPQSWLILIPVSGSLLALGASAWSWGSLFCPFLPLALAVPLGLASLAWMVQVIGLLGGLAYFPGPWMLAVLLAPVALRFLFSASEEKARFQTRPSGLWLFLAAPLFLAFASVATVPDPMPDPLWYHLTSARWWLDAGRIFFPADNVALFLTGSWDALYLWAGFLVGGPGEAGLIPMQILGQWIHFLFAGLGVCLLLYRFFRHAFPLLSGEARAFLTLFSLFSASQLHTLALAKNDWGAALFLLAGLVLWLEHRSLLCRLAAGLLLGLAFSSKLSVFFVAWPLFIWLAWHLGWRRFARELGAVALGLVAGMAPWLARNGMLAGAFFYPLFAELSPSWKNVQLYSGSGLSVENKGYLLKAFLHDSPFLWLFVPALPLAWVQRRKLSGEFLLLSLMVLSQAFFLLRVGAFGEIRLFGLGCLLLPSASIGCLLSVAALKLPAERILSLARNAALVVGIGAGLWLKVPFASLASWAAMPSPPELIRSHFGGTALAWMRLELPKEARIVSANEFRLYYLSERRVARMWDNPVLDQKLSSAQNVRDVVRALQEAGYGYLIFTRLEWDKLFQRRVHDLLEAALGRHREAVVFRTENSLVVKLDELGRLISDNE